jgi:putative aldouronate transport system substrate-binding protein
MLYSEGLYPKDVFTLTNDQKNALLDTKPQVVGFSNGNVGDMRAAGIDAFHLAPLKGPTGVQYALQRNPWSPLTSGIFITDACKDVELALALYDYFLSWEVTLDGFYGAKGTYWEDAPAGTKSIEGGTAIFQLTQASTDQNGNWATPVNATWDQNEPHISNRKFYMSRSAMDYDNVAKFLSTGDASLKDSMMGNPTFTDIKNFYYAQEGMPYGIPAKYFIPPIVFNEEDNARISDINATVRTYRETARAEFITGAKNINNDAVWNAYVADLERMGGVSELERIYNKYLK